MKGGIEALVPSLNEMHALHAVCVKTAGEKFLKANISQAPFPLDSGGSEKSTPLHQ